MPFMSLLYLFFFFFTIYYSKGILWETSMRKLTYQRTPVCWVLEERHLSNTFILAAPRFPNAPPRFPLSFLWALLSIMGLAVWPPRFRPGCRVELHTFITDCDTELPCRFVPTGSLFPNPLIRVENEGKEWEDGTIWNGRGGTLEKTPCDSVRKPNQRTWDRYYEALDAHMCV